MYFYPVGIQELVKNVEQQCKALVNAVHNVKHQYIQYIVHFCEAELYAYTIASHTNHCNT